MNGRVVLIAVVALLVGLALGAGWGVMQKDELNQQLAVVTQEKEQAVQSASRLRRMSEDAVRKYGVELGKLVNAVEVPAPAAPQVPGGEAQAPAPATGHPAPAEAKLVDSARAILAARDGMRASLDGVRAAMDGEMDQLAAELGNPAPNGDKLSELLSALKKNWPAKEQQLEAAARKLLTDLGVIAAPKPAVAPAAPAAPAAAAPAAAATPAGPPPEKK
jgi:2-oxoglutarate dehydrogenase E2 component (dihydrolipoamide succinyltransferase)